jgi:coatomer subunit beta
MTLRTSECHGDNELVLYVEPAHQARYIRCIFELLNASSDAVKYESCYHPDNFCSAATSCFINLVTKESDSNVKLIVLDRLDTLRSKHGYVLDGLIMGVLQVLSRSVFVLCCSPFAGGDHVI